MDKKNDVQLIRRILSGDDEAFSILVRRHQKGIHALAWRKVGDFHVAEEITQDTFLQVYKNLAQLKNPNQFAGWMYVIASRLCLKWIQKHKNTSVIHSLENTLVEEIDESSYTHHVSEQRKAEITENRHELVKKLLAKLPESERTIVTLYYLGEMTAKEIGKYLGVSVNTVKSRLRRGRKRLQEQQEELLVSETLGSIPFPAHVTERIMEQVADMKPIPPPVGKPLLPWAAFGTAVALVILLLGASNQYLARFQKPYSFEAESEPTIEIVDAPIVLDIVSKPSIRNQFGQAVLPGKSNSAGIQVSETVSKSNMLEDSRKSTTSSQWTEGNAPPGGRVQDMFATSEGTVYAVAPTGMYRLAADATAWTHINTDIPIGKSRMPMAEYGGRLYIASVDEIFTSVDSGETWHTLGSRPNGHAVGLIITDAPQDADSQADITMYLALRDEGVFRSTDSGKTWRLLIDGMMGTRVQDLVVFNNKLYAHTGFAVYQSIDEGVSWKKLSITEMFAVKVITITHESSKPNKAHVHTFFDSKLVVDDNNFYFLSSEDNNLLIVRLSTDGDTLSSPVQSIATFDDEASLGKLRTRSEKSKETYLSDGSEKDPLSIVSPSVHGTNVNARRVVVSNDVFYVEHARTLFKWRPGDPEWTNTGLTDKGPSFNDDFRMEIKLAVSGDTVYVGKRDGKLFQSFDSGNSWRDVTPSLPLYFARFKEITFVGSTVYVTTNEGVLSSETGAHWRVITDSTGARTIIDKFAMDGTKVYGINDAGVYRLDTHSRWEQISSEVPDKISALTIANNKLYSATKDRGILHISLEEE